MRIIIAIVAVVITAMTWNTVVAGISETHGSGTTQLEFLPDDSRASCAAEGTRAIHQCQKTKLALTCFKPFKPFLPFKPLWCTGTWTQILECDPNCNCVWRAVCLQ